MGISRKSVALAVYWIMSFAPKLNAMLVIFTEYLDQAALRK